MKTILKHAVVLVFVAALAGCSAAKQSEPYHQRELRLQEMNHGPSTGAPDIDIIHKPLVVPTPKKTTDLKGIFPARIYIPAIDLHAEVQTVIVKENGQMDVPKDDKTVGYLLNGVHPGAMGNAVMDGHYDNYKGAAVFFDLKRLREGDRVIVKNKNGATIEFAVESVHSYRTADAPISAIFGKTNEARLNLITCSGKYSRSKKEHQERLVVYTKRLE